MKYLVLRRFRSYGKQFEKGMVVDESEIRSPLLRMSEGKIVPAVSSSTVPAEPGDDEISEPASADTVEDADTSSEDIPPAEEGEPPEDVDSTPETVEPEVQAEEAAPPKKPFLTFKKG